MSKTILLGGSGFLGPVILSKDPEIISIGRSPIDLELKNKHYDLKSLDDLSLLDDIDFDKVIFLVGSSNHHEINNKITMGIDYNVYPIQKILKYLSKRKISKFICFTSMLLYDQKKLSNPVDEKQIINPYINDYVFSKYLSEEIVKFYENQVPSIVIRLSNIYGYTKLIRPDLVPTLMQNVLTSDNATIWNDKPKRDFIFTEDAADATLKLLDTNFKGIVNLGTGEMNAIKTITSLVEDLSGKKIKSLNKPVSGPMELKVDTTLLKKLIKWDPKFSLKEGLAKTYEIMKNYSEKK
tara:strand:+ start:466 stop:1350 length:885 start_codon:yes stop_codon:yes gene_type:complete